MNELSAAYEVKTLTTLDNVELSFCSFEPYKTLRRQAFVRVDTMIHSRDKIYLPEIRHFQRQACAPQTHKINICREGNHLEKSLRVASGHDMAYMMQDHAMHPGNHLEEPVTGSVGRIRHAIHT